MTSLHEQDLRRQQERLAEENRQVEDRGSQDSEGEPVFRSKAEALGTYLDLGPDPTPLPQSAEEVVDALEDRRAETIKPSFMGTVEYELLDMSADHLLFTDALTLLRTQGEEIAESLEERKRLANQNGKLDAHRLGLWCENRELQSRLTAANEVLRRILKLDKTRYDHHDPRPDGKLPKDDDPPGSCWLTPKQLATAHLGKEPSKCYHFGPKGSVCDECAKEET